MQPEHGECAELVAARRQAPAIAARAVEFERMRRLAPETVQAMVDADFVQMAIPAVYGGRESRLDDILRVVEEISWGDASAGWCLMNYQTTAFVAALIEPRWGSEIFGAPVHAVPAGVLAPTARAYFVDGGMVVNGRWAFASGCDNANWLLGTVAIVTPEGRACKNPDGSSQVLLPFFSRDQFTIIDTWQVSGLRASGSHDVEVQDAFIPTGRWLTLNDPLQVDGPLYRFPIVSTFPPAVAAVALGTARAALDYFLDLARNKVPAGGTTPLRDRAAAQIDVAHAEALIDSARSYLYETVDSLWRTVEQGGPATIDARRRIRLAGTYAAATAARAVDLVYNAAGASAIADSCPLQRHFRDVHAVTQHLHVSGAGFERMGKLRLTGIADALL